MYLVLSCFNFSYESVSRFRCSLRNYDLATSVAFFLFLILFEVILCLDFGFVYFLLLLIFIAYVFTVLELIDRFLSILLFLSVRDNPVFIIHLHK